MGAPRCDRPLALLLLLLLLEPSLAFAQSHRWAAARAAQFSARLVGQWAAHKMTKMTTHRENARRANHPALAHAALSLMRTSNLLVGRSSPKPVST